MGNGIPNNIYTPVFLVVLFTIAQTWKQPKYLLMDEWIKKIWVCVHTMHHCLFCATMMEDCWLSNRKKQNYSLTVREAMKSKIKRLTPSKGLLAASSPSGRQEGMKEQETELAAPSPFISALIHLGGWSPQALNTSSWAPPPNSYNGD